MQESLNMSMLEILQLKTLKRCIKRTTQVQTTGRTLLIKINLSIMMKWKMYKDLDFFIISMTKPSKIKIMAVKADIMP